MHMFFIEGCFSVAKVVPLFEK